MTLTSRSLCLAIPLVLSACVDTQSLGDPQETDGGSGSTQAGDASTTDGTAAGETDASTTEGETEGTTQAGDSSTTDDPTDTETETDGSSGGDVCADYEPPQIDNCAAGGKSSASGVFGVDVLDPIEDAACRVLVVDDDGSEAMLELDCGGERYPITYASASPHLVAPIAVDDDVLLSVYPDDEFEVLQLPPSFSVRTPGGELLLAYLEHRDLEAALPVPLSGLTASYGDTGCAAFESGEEYFCDVASESIVSGHVSVDLQTSEGPAGSVQAGGTAPFVHAGRDYDLIVQDANRIVCWDDSCASDETGPTDLLRMLLVAQ